MGATIICGLTGLNLAIFQVLSDGTNQFRKGSYRFNQTVEVNNGLIYIYYTVINRLMIHLKSCCPEHDYNLIIKQNLQHYHVHIENVYIINKI